MGRFSKIISLLLVCAHASAAVERAVVAGPDVTDRELRDYVETHDRKTLSETLDTLRPGAAREELLRSRLERAQRAWLNGSVDQAKTSFTEIAEAAYSADWKDSQREAIMYAFLRLAQSCDSPLEKASWLERANRFAPDLEPDASLFPPPLLASFKEARAKISIQSTPISFKDAFPGFRTVLIDGRKVDVESSAVARVPPGTHRITALDDRFAPITETLTAAQLGVFRVKGTLLATACESRVADVNGIGVEVFDGERCPSSKALVPQMPAPDFANVPTEVSERPKRNWLLIGAVALGAAAVYAIAHQPKSAGEPTPTHREGF